MLDIVDRIALTIAPGNDNPFLQGPFRPNANEYVADTDNLIGEIPRACWVEGDRIHGKHRDRAALRSC